MMRRSTRLMCAWLVGCLSVLALVGCERMTTTPATFTAGSNDPNNPLSGAAIANDGDTFQLSNFGAASEQLVIVSGGASGTRNLDFDLESGQAFPREIGVGDAPADNSLAVARTAGTATASLDIPGVGRMDFTVTIDDPLALSSRRINQVDACTLVRDACNEFCVGYTAGAAEAQEALTQLIVDEAEAQGVDEAAFIERTIAEIFDAVTDFCVAWAEVQAGVAAQTDPVDVCATEG